MSTEVFRRLIANGQVPVEHRALWAMLWDGELRLGDALSVDVRDVDLAAGTVRVEGPRKEPGPLVAPLSAEAAGLVREVIGDREEGPLLVNASGRRVARETASRWARSAGHGVDAFRTGGRLARLSRMR